MRTKINWCLTCFMALMMQITFAQQRTVSGTVTDESGLPLPGVGIVIKGTPSGTQTDLDGKFKVQASPSDVLIFSYIGMKNQELAATSNNLSIRMTSNAEELDIVVVTALGIKRKPDEITTASQVVRSEELNQAKAANAAVGLVGKVSGLQINTNGNGVNPNTRIQLRGFRSITGNNEALIVINGVISTAGAFTELNPEIIESVNVLKGSNGAALYGSQGSNGVIIVTTKRGTKNNDKFSISLNTSYTIEEISLFPKLQSRYGQGYQGAQDFSENTSWGPELDGSLQPTGLEERLMPYSYIKDNYKKFFNKGNTALNSIAISSGSRDNFINLSIGNQETNGTTPTDKFKKNNFYLGAGKTAGRWSVEGSMRYTSSTENTAGGVEGSINSSLYQVPVNVPVEQFSNPNNATHWTYWELNPYWRLQNEREVNKGQTFEGVGEVGYKFNDNISATYRASFRSTSFNYYSFFNGYTPEVVHWDNPLNFLSSYEVSNSNTRRIYSDFLLNFDYMLTEDISFKANIGNNITNIESNSIGMTGNGLVVPGLYNIRNITGNTVNTDSKSQERGYAFFANVDLGYKDYLFLNFTARNEWTSVLAKDNNSFFYPSAGVSFIPTKAFDFGGDILTHAKLSASIVKVGNKVIGPYAINDRFVSATTAGFPYTNTGSFSQSTSITAADLNPEFNLSKEFNLNLEFFKRRITFDASYYYSDNTDQILATSPSYASGALSATVNIGETKSQGIELDLGLTPFKTEDFSWDLRLSYSAPKTEVVRATDNADQVSVGGFAGANQTAVIAAIVGQEFPMLVGTGYERDDQGRIVVDATTGDPIKATNVNLGKTTPDYILGLSTSVNYKGFRLSGVFDYRTGHVFYAPIIDGLVQNGSDIVTAENGRQPFIMPNSVISNGAGGYIPNNNVATSGGQDYYTGIYREIDENFVVDATAFKCRELALSYSFNEKALKNTFLSSLTVGLNARNVFMILPKENRNYTDPEFTAITASNVGSGNNVGLSSSNIAPPTRSYGFNINITF